jgi:diguanylate cyclase (GGDEF)-like protein
MMLIGMLCGSLFCGALLYGAYAVVREESLDSLDTQQTILAQQAAQGIQDYFASIRTLSWSTAQNTHVVQLDAEGKQYLLRVLRENPREVLAITRIDDNGTILFSTPDNSVAGRNITGQNHIARMLANHSPTVSDVFASVQGYHAVSLAVPVFKGEKFRGSLGILLDFDAIARRYLEGVRVAETGHAFVFSQKGVLLYSPSPDLAAKHYAVITKGFPALRAMVERMLAGESGTGTFTFNRVRGQTQELVQKRAVFMPIKLGDTFWSICVATPESEILSSLDRLTLYLLPLASMMLLCAALGLGLGLRHFMLEKEIKRRRETEAELEKSARRFHSLFDNMTEGVALCTLVRDASGTVVNYRLEEVNHSFEGIFNIQATDVAGLLVTEALGLPQPPFLIDLAEVAQGGQACRLETMIEPLSKHVALSAVPWADGGFAAIFADITERKQMESQLRYRALHDPLTGLANRTLCLDRIALAGERARRRSAMSYAVVFMDLDRFKIINDSLGHEAGDTLLREVASRLLTCTRRMDTVCRYGGDEFALVLEELSAREVLRTLRRIRESLRNSMNIGGHAMQVEASFGIAYPPAEPIGAEDILRNANIALHRAKHLGRNRMVVYKQSMHAAAIEIMSLENDIRRGLAGGEFHMFYQPTFDLRTKQLFGFEALLRWNHPSRGAVSPAEFIPVAEESGSIFELGAFALTRACQEMADLQRAHPEAGPLVLTVNLSPRQFARQGLAEQIDRALSVSELPPKSLMLEITESSIMKHPESSANILSRIKERGVGIAIDDFGTGYSSLSALQQLPLDCLKIDHSFVARITESTEDQEIVRAIITLAESLHLSTVAEGIETEAQRLLLLELGCQLGQGYLCSPARPLLEAARDVNPEVCRSPFPTA